MPKQYKVFSVEVAPQDPTKKKWGWVLLDDTGEPLAISANLYDEEKDAKDNAKKTKNNTNATGP